MINFEKGYFFMAYRGLILFLTAMLILAACAPENLDITPTVAPTLIPTITVYVTGAVAQTGTTIDLPLGSRVSDAIEAAGGATDQADLQRINLAQALRDGDQVDVPVIGAVIVEATPEATAAVTVSEDRTLLDHILASLPGTVNAGVISWRRDQSVELMFVERDGGTTARISFNEPGGGLMELTFGVFSTPDLARTYYDTVRGQLRTLERAEERDIFPTPNAFGGGTYGSDAIFARDNIFIRISIPRFSSTAGDPLNPAARQVFAVLDDALASYSPS
jgi:hypothetical protein